MPLFIVNGRPTEAIDIREALQLAQFAQSTSSQSAGQHVTRCQFQRRPTVQLAQFVSGGSTGQSTLQLKQLVSQQSTGGYPSSSPGIRRSSLTVGDLDDEARQYYGTCQKAISDGGQDLLKFMMNKHFQDQDKDRSGTIDRTEFTKLAWHIFCNRLKLPMPDDRMLQTMFDSHDRNGTGVLESGEFEELYPRLLKRALGQFRIVGKDELLRSSKKGFNEKYQIQKMLSEGAQGVTYLATERKTGSTVVVKKPKTPSTEDFYMLRDKSHPNLVRVFELFSCPAEIFVVMEFCGGGDLFGALRTFHESFGAISLNFIAHTISQCMRGVHYIHNEFKECHNDLKPENVLLDRKPRSLYDLPRVMVADFGCVSGLGELGGGDPRYRAPELWQGAHVNTKTDVWSLGIMLYEMLSGGMLAFTGHMNISGWEPFVRFRRGELLQRLKSNLLLPGAQPDWKAITCGKDSAIRLCQSMLAWNPLERTTLSYAMQRSFVQLADAAPVDLPTDITSKLASRALHSNMKVALLNKVVSTLQGENLEYYRQIWNRFDKDNSGSMSSAEFRDMVLQLGPGFDERVANELAAQADIDNNNVIDFNEFIALMFSPEKLSPGVLEERLMSSFNDLADGRDMITYADLKKMFPDGMSETALISLFTEMDADKSGAVDMKEFRDFVASL